MVSDHSISDADSGRSEARDPLNAQWLRTFAAVARLGSFSAAAEELRYTQSAVSQQVAALEKDLGTAVLRRRPVEPTEAGARLLEHAGPVLLRLAAARTDAERAREPVARRLAVAACPGAFGAAAAWALARVRAAEPRLEASVRTAPLPAVVGGVASGEFDAGLVDGVAAPSDPLRLGAAEGGAEALRTELVAESPLVVALPAAHPLAGRSGVRLADLVDALWIDAPGASVPLEVLRDTDPNASPRAALRLDGGDAGALEALVAAGHGAALVPRGRLRGVAEAPVVAPRLVHRTELVHLDPRGPAQDFAEALVRRGTSAASAAR
ncbi:LysR family transcriptional regulator [Nocardiopsis sp. RSe5-2]|uniref:LysR family transcriptional regulator n=1 Tax=Nocardiopsis endophytica TaxID=3018445 RepID=A0ABT4U7B0_9ACTN|nr:LysR family transcriptional regulator [Nocardiopsis endophytica]MDA2812232.1 LysR family transcriptional regulator [Nocardiopsis endophytica]